MWLINLNKTASLNLVASVIPFYKLIKPLIKFYFSGLGWLVHLLITLGSTTQREDITVPTGKCYSHLTEYTLQATLYPIPTPFKNNAHSIVTILFLYL